MCIPYIMPFKYIFSHYLTIRLYIPQPRGPKKLELSIYGGKIKFDNGPVEFLIFQLPPIKVQFYTPLCAFSQFGAYMENSPFKLSYGVYHVNFGCLYNNPMLKVNESSRLVDSSRYRCLSKTLDLCMWNIVCYAL